MSALTKGQWQLSGVRFRMNGGEWQSITAYDAETKQDTSIAAVSIDPRTLAGLADGLVMAASKDMLEALSDMFVNRDSGVQVIFGGNPIACERLEAKCRAAIARATGEGNERALSEGEEG